MVKNSGDKPDGFKIRYDLMPTFPQAQVAYCFTVGLATHPEDDWRKGMNYSRLVGAMERHLALFKSGEDRDPQFHQHHLAAVSACAFILMEYQHTGAGEDDRHMSDLRSALGLEEDGSCSFLVDIFGGTL